MKLARVIVFSADVRKLARWYIDVFGLDANEISDGWADLGSVALHSGGRKRTRDCGHKLVFYAKDVTRARGRLLKRGTELGPVASLAR
jgi:hypothetical protein